MLISIKDTAKCTFSDNRMKADFENSKVLIYKLKDDIIKVLIKDSASIEVEDLLEMKDFNKKLAGGKDYYLLFIAGKDSHISKEAREKSTGKEISENKLAQAFVVQSLAHKIIANFFINIQKPSMPTKMFTNEKEAIHWLKSLKGKSKNEQ